MDFKCISAGDHLTPPPSPSPLPPPIRCTENDHPPPEITTKMSYTQNAPPETTTVMNCTQSAPLETTMAVSYTPNDPLETTSFVSYTQNAPPETTTVMSYTQNAPTVMSYAQSAPTTSVMSYTQNAPPEKTTMMSYTQNAPPEMTKMMSYTQNAPPATTMMSYTQHKQSLTYFTQQGIRAGFVAPHLENKVDRIQHRPVNMHEAIWREFEKERIREEIIAEEVDRRRMLELEVRRELLMERLSAKQSGEGFSLSSPVMGFPPTFPLLKQRSDLRSVEERVGMSLEDRMGRGLLVSRLGARNEIGRLEIVPLEGRISENPFQQRSMDPKISAFKPLARSAQPTISELQTPLEPSGEKDKIIFLPKPISGVKRKADTPPVEVVASQPPSLDVLPKKKGKEDWSCALCQVSATSERGLNDHLQGKKHKSKEAALREHRTGNYSIGLLSKKPKTINLVETNDKLNMAQMEKPKVELLPHSKSGEEGSSLVILEKEGAKDDVIPSLDDHHANDLEKSADVTTQTKKKKNKKKKYQFWCATCRVGALSEVSMEAHRNGKKHKARLRELSSVVATSDADVETARTVNEALQEVVATSDADVETAHTVDEALQEVEETVAEEQEEVFTTGDN